MYVYVVRCRLSVPAESFLAEFLIFPRQGDDCDDDDDDCDDDDGDGEDGNRNDNDNDDKNNGDNDDKRDGAAAAWRDELS